MPGHHAILSSLAASVLLLAGCSVLVLEPEPCQSNQQCTESFGAGSICADNGFCEITEGGANLCSTIADCLASGGFGQTCSGADPDAEEPTGTCITAELPLRCTARFLPTTLFTDPGGNADSVVFGVLSDRSVRAHLDRENAISLAVSHINENGGIDDHPIGLVFCDIQEGSDAPFTDGLSRRDAVVDTAEWLVEVLGVPVILGPPSSGDTEIVFEDITNAQAVRGQTLLMSPSATDLSLTNFDIPQGQIASDNAPGMLWRTAPSAEPQVAALIGQMEADGVTNVAIIREQSPFAGTSSAPGESFAQRFGTDFSGASDQFTYEGGNVSGREQRIREVGMRLEAGEFDAVLFLGPFKDSREFLKEATDNLQYGDDLPLYFADTGAMDDLFTDIGDPRLFDNVYATRPALPVNSFILDNFVEAFDGAYGANALRSTFTAHAYDAVWFAALGSTWALFHGPESTAETESGYPLLRGIDIARGLRRTSVGSDLDFIPTEWPSGLSNFRSNRTVDAVGAASNYDFDLATEEAPAAAELLQGTAEGTFELVGG